MFLSSDTLKQSKAKQSKAKPFLGVRKKGLEISEELADASVVIVAGSCGFYCNSDIKLDENLECTPFCRGCLKTKNLLIIQCME